MLKVLTINLDNTTGKLTRLKIGENSYSITQQLQYYEGAQGDNSIFENRASGAYIFRPNKSEAIVVTNNVIITTYKGQLFEEIHQQFNEWLTQIIRVYASEDYYIEFDWIVGPIDTT